MVCLFLPFSLFIIQDDVFQSKVLSKTVLFIGLWEVQALLLMPQMLTWDWISCGISGKLLRYSASLEQQLSIEWSVVVFFLTGHWLISGKWESSTKISLHSPCTSFSRRSAKALTHHRCCSQIWSLLPKGQLLSRWTHSIDIYSDTLIKTLLAFSSDNWEETTAGKKVYYLLSNGFVFLLPKTWDHIWSEKVSPVCCWCFCFESVYC